jgi:lipopolysaccharide export system permease protein
MALKASGISLWRILFPLQVLVLGISIGAFVFMNNVMPYTNLKMGALLYSVRHQSPEVSIETGVFNNDIENYSIKVDNKNQKTGVLYNVTIYDHKSSEGNRVVTKADSATMMSTADKKNMVFTLYNGQTYQEEKEKKRRQDDKEYPHRTNKFKKQRLLLDMSGMEFQRTDEELFKNNYQMLNMNQLDYAVDSLDKVFLGRKDDFIKSLYRSNYFKKKLHQEKDSAFFASNTIPDSCLFSDSLLADLPYYKKTLALDNAKNYARSTKSYIASTKNEFQFKSVRINKHKNEWHKKMVIAISCILLFFIGAPLGAIIRKGGLGLPVVVSVIMFVIYYVISMSAEKSARQGTFDPWIGMWFSSFVVLPLGIILTYQAVNDSVLLSKESYKNGLKKLLKLFKRAIPNQNKEK